MDNTVTHIGEPALNTGSKSPAYDRHLLLEGAKRNAVLDSDEVANDTGWKAGVIPTTFAFTASDLWIGTEEGYGFWGERRWNVPAMCWPTESVETSPPLRSPPRSHPGHDTRPFAGSGNTLYWMLRHLPGAHGLGLEQDSDGVPAYVSDLAILNLSIEMSNRDYRMGLSTLTIAQDQLLIAFIAPPWGDAFERAHRSGFTPHNTAHHRDR